MAVCRDLVLNLVRVGTCAKKHACTHAREARLGLHPQPGQEAGNDKHTSDTDTNIQGIDPVVLVSSGT